MATRFVLPHQAIYNINGAPLSGAKAYFYETGTSTPKDTYSDSALSVANTNPVIADASGRFSDIFISGVYKTVLKDSNDVQIYEADPVDATGITADLVPYTPAGGSAVATNVQDKLREVVSAVDFGAVHDGSTDDTAAIQAALDSGAAHVVLPSGTYVIYGTLTIPAGVTLAGVTIASEYYPGEASGALTGTLLLKPASGSTVGPIVQMATAAGLENVYLKHLLTNGATTGIVRMGAVGTTVTCYNAHLNNVQIYGDPTTDITGSTTCYGIYFPQSISSAQRYFNRFTSVYITACDIAIHLDEESNGNNFSQIITRQCLYHYELDGNAGACVDNVFTGLGLYNIGALTGDGYGFVLKNGAQWNNFVGYQTEMNEAAFNLDSTSTLNIFIGQENEINPSYVPPAGIAGPTSGNIHARWQRPINIDQYTQMVLPTLTTGARFDSSIAGSRLSFYQSIDGTAEGLPALDGVGTLVAGAAHSRKIIKLKNLIFLKGLHPNFVGKLTLFLQAGGTSGHAIVTVEFQYVCTNTSTDAGLFRVTKVDKAPSTANYIAGLYFITGVTDNSKFKFAIAGGNLSATPATSIHAALDIDVYKPNPVNRDDYAGANFDSAAITANDVTDAIDMLTVAETVV